MCWWTTSVGWQWAAATVPEASGSLAARATLLVGLSRKLARLREEVMVRCPQRWRAGYVRLLLGPGASGGFVVLFGSRNREFVTDSTYSVYASLQDHPSVRAIWVGTRDQVRRLRESGRSAIRANGLQHRLLLHVASLAVISYQVTDVARDVWRIPERLPFVYLGHGKSIKRSGASSKGHRSAPYRRRAWLLRRQTVMAVASSTTQGALLAEAYDIDRSLVRALGEARTDVLVRSSDALPMKPPRRILYAPTWRQGAGEPTRFLPFDDFSLDGLVSWLEKVDGELILRPHPKEMHHPMVARSLHRLQQSSPRVQVSRAVDHNALYEEMARASVLVSDYSSVVEEFLLCDRPIVLVPYDYERFSQRQGFLVPLEESMPGPVVGSFASLTKELSRALDGEDPFAAQRRDRRDQVHSWVDGRSTERVRDAILSLLPPSPQDRSGRRGPGR
jgi:hypothetical protein